MQPPAILKHHYLLQVRMKRTVGCVLREATVMAKGRLLTTHLAYSHCQELPFLCMIAIECPDPAMLARTTKKNFTI